MTGDREGERAVGRDQHGNRWPTRNWAIPPRFASCQTCAGDPGINESR